MLAVRILELPALIPAEPEVCNAALIAVTFEGADFNRALALIRRGTNKRSAGARAKADAASKRPRPSTSMGPPAPRAARAARTPATDPIQSDITSMDDHQLEVLIGDIVEVSDRAHQS